MFGSLPLILCNVVLLLPEELNCVALFAGRSGNISATISAMTSPPSPHRDWLPFMMGLTALVPAHMVSRYATQPIKIHKEAMKERSESYQRVQKT